MDDKFPKEVSMDIQQYVRRWYVIVRVFKMRPHDKPIVMMRPFRTYDEARAFQYAHRSR